MNIALWFIAPAIPNSIWKEIGLGAAPAPSSIKFKKGDGIDTIPVVK